MNGISKSNIEALKQNYSLSIYNMKSIIRIGKCIDLVIKNTH